MTDGRLNILVLGDSRSFHIERYVTELRHQNCHVMVASLEAGTMHHYTLKSRTIIRSFWYALAATEVRAVIKKFKPDIIDVHFASGYGFTAALAQARSFAPVFLHLWGSDVLIVPEKSRFHRRKTAYALAQADFVTADSQFLLDEADELARIRRSRVIPWGMERRFLNLHRTDYSLGKPLRIIVPRPQEKIYNNMFVVRALEPLINSGQVRVTFPAWGSLLGHFRLNSRTLVDDRLDFYEKLPRADFLALMASHDVYLSSAVSDSSPATLIEAMGLGLIPISGDIPGVREWLHDGQGYLFDLYRAEQLRNRIAALIDTGDEHREMRERNLARVKASAIFEDNVAQTIAIMRELIEERKR